MHQMSLMETIVLAGIVSSFVLFGAVLFLVSVYVSLGKTEEPIARTVTPAKRADHTAH